MRLWVYLFFLLILDDVAASDIWGAFKYRSRAGIYPKYPDETVLFPVYTTN